MELPQTHIIIGQLNRNIVRHNAAVGKCVPDKPCKDFMLDNNCSCEANVSNVTCPGHVPDSSIPVILWSFSAAIVGVLILELLAIRLHRSYLNNFLGKMIFCMGIVVSIVTQLCTIPYVREYSSDPTLYYNIFLGIASIAFASTGFLFLFEESPNNNIGSHDEGMGLVLTLITIPLIILELFLTSHVFKNSKLSNLLGTFLVIWCIEKIVQTAVYVMVRKCVSREDYKDGAIFYFSFLSFLNFTMWLNSIPFTGIKLYDSLSADYWLADRAYKALVIDFRLLCALLFLEYALALFENHEEIVPATFEDDVDFQPQRRKCRLYTIAGIITSALCLALEIGNGIQFWVKAPIGVNICPILVDTILVVCGIWLLKHVGVEILHNERISLVVVMVASMGAVAIVYLMIFSCLCIVLLINHDHDIDGNHDYVTWSSIVFLARSLSLLVLLVVYTGVPFSAMALADNQNPISCFLTWTLCGGFFARFLGSIVDEFHGTMHHLAHELLQAGPLRSVRDLFDIGPLFHLATCLHLALHFLLMIIRLFKPPKRPVVVLQGGNYENPNPVSDGDVAKRQSQQPNNNKTVIAKYEETSGPSGPGAPSSSTAYFDDSESAPLVHFT